MLQKMRKALAALLLIALLLPVTAVPALAKSVEATVNSSSARVYKSRSTSSEHVKVKKGLKVTVKEIDGDWAKIKSNGHTGYIPVKYLDMKGGSSSSSSSSTTSVKSYTAYVRKDTHMYAKASSSSDRKSVAAGTKVKVIGVDGKYSQIKDSHGNKGYVKTDYLTTEKPSSSSSGSSDSSEDKSSWKDKVVKLDWFHGGSSVLNRGSYAYIYDIRTGIKVKIKRMGGANHADCEPATSEDTAKLKRISGGHWSWHSRAVILISEGKYVAAAINTMPHGDQTISDNDYDGQFCLHLTNSRTHGTDKVHEDHQSSINKAYNWAH